MINSFSSRGISVTVPVGKQNEISFAAMNGTSIVGFANFIGVSRRKHSLLSTTFAREFFKERPNGAHVEFSAMRGSLLPLTNLNQGEVNDAEKSLGFGFKVIGSDTKQRLRYQVGITRSKFTNPPDPLLEQGLTVTPIREVWRTARFNRSTSSGNSGFTDIMAIPPAVVRRAYQAALRGDSAGFFYVRRFVSNNGQPDQFVNVTCRMSGGGARVPFALTNVELKTPQGEPILFIKSDEQLSEIVAEIQYNGTGRLKGRREIVQPGEELPDDKDLLTEATLPLEQRGTQRRFTQIARFNEFLQPTGKYKLPLKLTNRIPTLAAGQYLLLLRIEATDDKESDSNLAAIGVGNTVVHSGAVASFPMPILKFFVAGENVSKKWAETALVLPQKNVAVETNQSPIFTWKELPETFAYRLEVLYRVA